MVWQSDTTLEIHLKGKYKKNNKKKNKILISLDDLENIVNGINGLTKQITKQLIAKDKTYFSKELKNIFSMGLVNIEEGSAILDFSGFRQDEQATMDENLKPDYITSQVFNYINNLEISENKLHLDEAIYLNLLLKPITNKHVSIEISTYKNQKQIIKPKKLNFESKQKLQTLIDNKKLIYGEEIYGLLKELNIKDYSLQLQLYDYSMEKVYFDQNKWEQIRDMLGSKVKINLTKSKSVKTMLTIEPIQNFQEKKSMTGKDLLDSGLFGILKNNEEMKDSVAFAKKLANEVF
ncbi:hypothetical protein M1141_02880 [Candidatus Marsarchaeota archaeon]|nr:hypothetical protein [Candidatus Marsarchaeota archaeon]